MKDTRTPTYTGRSLQHVRIKAMHDDGQVDTEAVDPEEPGLNGWSWGGHPTLRNLEAGDVIMVETQNLSSIVGAAVPDQQTPDPDSQNGWRFRKSDQELAAEHAAWVFALERQREHELDTHRADWQRRENALPDWLRERVSYFHTTGGHHFDVDGWGYELVICELAALYAADEDWVAFATAHQEDSLSVWEHAPQTVKDYAHEQGTSGNQHGMAESLVRAHAAHPERSMAGTVSALSPLTGDPDYSAEQPTSQAAERAVSPAVVRIVFQIPGETDLVVEHPLAWDADLDPDTIAEYARGVLHVLDEANLLDTEA